MGTSSVVDQVEWIAGEFQLDLLRLALHDRGIMKYGTMQLTGEEHVLTQVLPRLLRAPCPTLFDVGANSGEYSSRLRQCFPNARIFALEPNPATFKTLQGKADALNVTALMIGASDSKCVSAIHSYAHDRETEHASLYAEVLNDLHGAQQTSSVAVSLQTLDEIVDDLGVDTIDFIKIDTEGHELAALRGAEKLLAAQRLRVIQFEFNEMNIVSRVFLKDFYDLLRNHEFYRLDTNRLLPLGRYSSRNEIFQFQNILAVPRGTSPC